MAELWNFIETKLPQRSILHHLNLAGLNTALIESLTGHLLRLSESHSVYLGVLMERQIAPIIAKQHGGGNLHKIYNHVCALNGTGLMASELARALSELTAHKQLQHLTMLRWSNVFPSRSLMRSTRAWCPQCYMEQYKERGETWELLLWTINVVQICPTHQRLLNTVCPHCNQTNPPLAWRSRSGYCYKCEKWLGNLSSTLSPDSKSNSEVELEWMIWTANAIGELLATAPSLSSNPSQVRVANGLSTCVKLFADGNIAEFARLIQVPRNTVWLWCNGKNLPQLDTLVKLCFRLKISVLDLLTQDEFEPANDSTRFLPNDLSLPNSRAEIKFTNHEQVHSQLLAVLLDHRLPPFSLEETARALGYHRETLFRNFKDLCHAISARYDQYEQVRHLKSIEECCNEVRRVVLQLHEQGIYPSEARVSQHLAKPGHLRYKQVRAALQEMRKSLC